MYLGHQKKQVEALPVLEWVPIDDRLLVRRLELEKRGPKGLIIIPDISQEKANKGIVLDVGEWLAIDESTHMKRKGIIPVRGDIILFGKYSGSEFEVIINGEAEEVLIMRLNDVIGINRINYYGNERIY